METDKINVSSDGSGREEALAATELLADSISLSPGSKLRLRLLAEETLGMVASISGEFTACFQAEGESNGVCIIRLEADTAMDREKRKEFISVSSSGRNEAEKGFMSKIKAMFERGISLDPDGSVQDLTEVPAYMEMGMTGPADVQGANSMMYLWSLERYRENVKNGADALEDAGDELEKSIVASLADDVKVSVSGNKVGLTIEYKA